MRKTLPKFYDKERDLIQCAELEGLETDEEGKIIEAK